MEYFAAYAVPLRSIDKIFSNKYIKNAISELYGEEINTFIQKMITKIATRGVQKSYILGVDVTNTFNTIFLISRLGLNPAIALKQLTSIPTYANDIGMRNWIKYSAQNKGEQVKVWKEVRENSVYMQDRKNDKIQRVLEAYNPKAYIDFIPKGSKVNYTIEVLMSLIKIGDRTAIMLGGLPNYSYYKAEFKKDNPLATEQEAIDYAIKLFERDTKRTQQSQDLQDKDFFQNNDPLVRAFNMFLTTPKQYLRKEIQATRNLYRKLAAGDMNAGKGTAWQNIRTFGMYHIFMPVIFQYVSLGFPGLLSDFDDDDYYDFKTSSNLRKPKCFIFIRRTN